MANIFRPFVIKAARLNRQNESKNVFKNVFEFVFHFGKSKNAENEKSCNKKITAGFAALSIFVGMIPAFKQNKIIKPVAESQTTEETNINKKISVVYNNGDFDGGEEYFETDNGFEDNLVENVVELFNEVEDDDNFDEITFETEDDGEPVNFNEIAEMLGEIEETDVPASETIEGFVTFEEIEVELKEDIRIFDENGNAIGEDCGCLEPSDFEKSISAMLEGKEDDLDWFSEYEIAEMLGMVEENFEEYGDFVLQFGDDEIGVSELLILNLAFKQGVMPCDIRKTFGTDDVAIYEAWCGVFKPHLKYDYLRSYFDLKIAADFAVAKEVA